MHVPHCGHWWGQWTTFGNLFFIHYGNWGLNAIGFNGKHFCPLNLTGSVYTLSLRQVQHRLVSYWLCSCEGQWGWNELGAGVSLKAQPWGINLIHKTHQTTCGGIVLLKSLIPTSTQEYPGGRGSRNTTPRSTQSQWDLVLKKAVGCMCLCVCKSANSDLSPFLPVKSSTSFCIVRR